MSWQCIVHCIGMASGTRRNRIHRPIPVHHETAPGAAQSASSTHCGSRVGVPAHAQRPNQAPRPTPPCIAAQHRSSSTTRPSVAAPGPRMPCPTAFVSLSVCLSACLSSFPSFSLPISLAAGPPSAPISHVKTPPSQWLWRRGRARPIGAAVRCTFAAPSCAASSDMQHYSNKNNHACVADIYVLAAIVRLCRLADPLSRMSLHVAACVATTTFEVCLGLQYAVASQQLRPGRNRSIHPLNEWWTLVCSGPLPTCLVSLLRVRSAYERECSLSSAASFLILFSVSFSLFAPCSLLLALLLYSITSIFLPHCDLLVHVVILLVVDYEYRTCSRNSTIMVSTTTSNIPPGICYYQLLCYDSTISQPLQLLVQAACSAL